MRRANFQHILAEILDPDSPIPHRHLSRLSNLSVGDLESLCQGWPTTPLSRRQGIAEALRQLTEDNLDLNFREVFLWLLEDPDEQVRAAAVDGLWEDESSTLLERLLHMAGQDPSVSVQQQAIQALGRFAYRIETTDRFESYRRPLLQILFGFMDDPSTPLLLRRRALETLAYLGQVPEVKEAIAQAYQSSEQELRVSAVRAMGRHLSPDWRPLIERELSSTDPEMRYDAAYACGELGEPEIVLHLAPLLKDEDHQVVRAAIWALGEIGGVRARRLLERCLQRTEEDLRAAAQQSLNTLSFFEDPRSASQHEIGGLEYPQWIKPDDGN